MNYRNRITVAAALSLVINALMFHYLMPEPRQQSLAVAVPRPLLLQVQPEPQETPQLVKPTQESEAPPEIQDRIAEFDARALDDVLKMGEIEAPRFEKEAPLDNLPAPPSLPLDATTPPVPEPVLVPLLPEPEAPILPQEATTEAIQMAARPMPLPTFPPQQKQDPEKTPKQPPPKDKPDATIPPPPLPPTLPSLPQPSRGRVQNSVKDRGFMNYAALQHELAPYLNEIRERVRREWLMLLMTRYSGTKPTFTEIEIAINPNGELTLNAVVNNNNDPVFAALCQEAIRRPAPFSEFGFEIPDIYRSKELQIHWTFNFL